MKSKIHKFRKEKNTGMHKKSTIFNLRFVLVILTLSMFSTFKSNAQCLYIESILADACNKVPPCAVGATEGENEMVLFKVGPTDLNIAYMTTATASLTPTWPNAGNSFKGWQTPGPITNPLVAALNSSIIKCGYLVEPVGGVLPANYSVLIITSTNMCTAGNSFANLTDTLYVIFQVAGNTNGHFLNNNNTGTITTTPTGTVAIRNFTLNYTGTPSCSETVSYQAQLLTNQFGTYGGSAAVNDGASIEYDALGNATYVNNGCKAPYIPIQVTATAPSTVCVNGTANLSATISGPAVSYSWTTSGTGTVSVPTGTLSGSGSTTVNPTYTPGAGESGAVTFTLTAQGKCLLAVVTNTVSINVIALPSPTVTSSNGATICDGNNTVLSVNNQSGVSYAWNPGGGTGTSFTVSPTSQTFYTVDATNSCGTQSATFTVDVNVLPTITVVNDSVCLGSSGTLNASGASTYTWNTGATGSSLSNAPGTTTQFTVTGTGANTCTNTATGTIVINQPPAVTVNSPSVCPGNTVTLTANNALTYTWNTTQTGNSITVSPSSTTSYTVTGTDGKGCTKTVVSTVTTFTPPNVSATNSTICPGNSATLIASGATTYLWNTGANTATITVTPTVTTTYSVTGTDVNGCKNSAVDSVSVVNTLTVTAVSTPTAICKGSSTTLTGIGANTFTWSTAGSLNFTTGTIISVSPTVTTTYSVIGSSGTCSDSNVVTVIVNSLPVVVANTSTTAICPGGTVTLTGSGTAITYTWTGGVIDGTSFSPSSTQTYTVTGTDGNLCSKTDTISVTVYSPPSITVPTASVCPGATATLSASGTATTFTWSTGSNNSSITVSPPFNPSYTVTGADAHLCKSTATGIIFVYQPASILVNSPSTCPGSPVTLHASGGVFYSWSTGQSGSGDSISVPGTFTSYTVNGTDINGCNDTAVATVSLLPLPTAQTVTGTSVICNGQNTILSVVNPGNYTYSWTGPAGSLGNGTSITANAAGIYTVTAANSCGSSGATFTVFVSSPQASFSPNILTGQAPANVIFTNTSTGILLQNYWNFSNGDTSHIVSPAETFTAAGSYDVVLVVTDSLGCKDTASIIILVTEQPAILIIPNIFSPNGDGINDNFTISGSGINNFNCKIYDRWGILLYEWFDLKGGWDGKNATDGTYFFLLNYTDNLKNTVNKPGYLQLVR